jgi:alanine racemase
VITHFACADAPESGFFKQQLHSVLELRRCLSGKVPLSAANSAGVLLYPEVCFDWVRPGIALYGCSPVAEKQSNYFDLRPALMLKSEIIACRDLSQGESVGYGASWRACQPTRMGVVAIGYGDGYPRQICNGSPVIVAGTATRIIGRVSMDMVTVDLTPVNFAGVGSQVELWGKQLSVDRVARYANTISYHLLTGISKRVPRRYLGIAGGFQVEN